MLDQVPEDTGHAEGARDFIVREAIFILHVKKHGRKHAAAAAGGRGDDGAVRGVLLGGGKGVGADKLEFPHLRNVEKVRPLIKKLCLPGDVQPAGENAGGCKTVLNLLAHGVPDGLEKVPDLGALVELDVFRQRDIAPSAELRDLGKRAFRVHVGVFICGLAFNDNVAAANRHDAHALDFCFALIGDKVHRVGVGEIGRVLGVKDDLRAIFTQRFFEHAVGTVSDAGLAQRAVENDGEAVSLRRTLQKFQGGTLGADGM